MFPPIPPEHRSRLVALEGCHNFRVVAEWRSGDGRHLRPGVLFRSAGLHQLSDADLQAMAALGITRVIDLRASAEIARAPSRLPAAPRPVVWSGAELAAEADLMAVMARPDADATTFREAMRRLYAGFPETLAESVRIAGRTILVETDGATLVHCAAGKDRTGFVVAMLLHAVGIHPDDIMADYLLSNASFDQALAQFDDHGRLTALEARSPGSLAALVATQPEYLDAATARIVADWGSLDTWLDQEAGLDASRRDQLAERLLTPAAA